MNSNLDVFVEEMKSALNHFSEDLRRVNEYFKALALMNLKLDPADIDMVNDSFKEKIYPLIAEQLRYMDKVSAFIKQKEIDRFTPKYAGEISIPPLFPLIPGKPIR